MPRTLRREISTAFCFTFDRGPRWAVLGVVAVFGSAVFGGSLSLVLPGWAMEKAALWLALSAGLAWCVFIPMLRFVTGVPWWDCLESCLVTMAFGEMVLLTGAGVNVALWQLALTSHAAWINAVVVGISNVVMLTGLAAQLRPWGVPSHHTVALWMLVLNGSGALLFLGLYRVLHGG